MNASTRSADPTALVAQFESIVGAARVEAIKRAVDPDGVVNPGSLGIH